jgi:uncharacterized protein (TIGR03435 family)
MKDVIFHRCWRPTLTLPGLILIGLMNAPGDQAQTPDPKLQFEVASVKISAPLTGGKIPVLLGTRGGPGTTDPGQLTIGYATMKNLLAQAFGVQADKILGPAWLDKTDGDRYDVIAKVPRRASKEDLKTMLQNLLVERFGLAFHREMKDVQGYEWWRERTDRSLRIRAEHGSTSRPACQDRNGSQWHPPVTTRTAWRSCRGRARPQYHFSPATNRGTAG